MTVQFNIYDLFDELGDNKKSKKKLTYKQIKFEDIKYSIDSIMQKHLDILISDLKDNDDGLVIIVGPEGAGKSYFASQLAHYCSKELNTEFGINQVHFDGEQYINTSLKSKKKAINFLDESRRALNKMRGTSTSNVEFMNFLSECRSQNQLHFILLPAFTDLEQYVAIHRCKLVLSIEKKRDEEGKLIRGTYNIWKSSNKSQLEYIWKNRYKEFPRHMLVHKGKFDNVLCINKEEYDNKKETAKKERYSTENNSETIDSKQQKYLIRYKQVEADRKYGLTWDKIGEKYSSLENPDKLWGSKSAHTWFSANKKKFGSLSI